MEDENRKMTLIRLEIEKGKIFQEELVKKEEKKRREMEAVITLY